MMETKLKTMTESEIFAKETALRDSLTALCEEYAPKFEALGHSLSCEFARCTETTEYADDTLEAPAAYRIGYNCRATLLVKRPKTEEELAACEIAAEDMEEVQAEEEEEGTAEAEASEGTAEAEASEETAETEASEETAEAETGEEAAEAGTGEETAEAEEAEEKEDAEETDVTTKTVAFTQLIFTRIYRSFWIDRIVLADGIDAVKEDLDEFLAKLAEKAENEAAAVD